MTSVTPSDSRAFLTRLHVRKWLRFLAVIASAILFSAAFPPHNLGWVAWFALVPFFLAIHGINRVQTYIVSAIWFLLFSVFLVDYYFLVRSPIFILIIVTGLTFQIVVVSELQLLSSKYGRWGWLLFSGLWVGIWFLIAFLVGMVYPLSPDLPFPSFANTQWLYPVTLQILPFVGQFGLALLVILVNKGLAEIVLRRRTRQIISPLAIIVILLLLNIGWGTYYLSADNPIKTVGVAIVPTGGNLGSEGDAATMTRDFVSYADNNRVLPDGSIIPEIGIIAWAEIPVGDINVEDTKNPVSDLAGELQRYLVANFYETQADGTYLNVAGIFGPEGMLLAQNVKRKIPPVVEGSIAGEKGAPIEVVATPWGRMSTLICYDTFFPDVVRKAAAQGVDFFVVPANPPSESVPRFTALHLSQTIFRAVENRTAIVLSYSNGISALIDSNGRLLLHESLNPEIYMKNSVAMSGALPVCSGGTFYSRWGDAFIWAVLFVSIAYAIGAKIRQIRRGSQIGQ